MKKVECKLCSNGFLTIETVSYFPSVDVRGLARVLFWFGCIGIVLGTFLGLLGAGAYFTGGVAGPSLLELALVVAIPLVGLLVALLGAIFSMKKPVLRCSNCTATHPAS
ncbi:MAG: hypothetical protein ACI87O_002518 [Planctomycetota bacterium]|jgi:hypothetical protein